MLRRTVPRLSAAVRAAAPLLWRQLAAEGPTPPLVPDQHAGCLAAALIAEADRERLRGSPVLARNLAAAACRAKCVDSVAARHAADGTRQFVLLGAGSDTRALRLGLPEDARVFEMDLDGTPALTERKHEAMRAAALQPTCEVIFAGSASSAALGETLVAAGLRVGSPVCWVLECVPDCLELAEAEELLAACAASCPPGSSVVFGCVEPPLAALAQEDADPELSPFTVRRPVPAERLVAAARAGGWGGALSYAARDLRKAFGREAPDGLSVVEGWK
eukprot:TRINITY_DN51822_c0_g1_i1.p2 TRINITY_DN51822_c0_g1~~TRINITY_DN51822_c0_g1_i1.p2  ORF type:complete len:299 (+),score=103.40 TRINITY_DN51822_c0_g1_i1:71-898(+)